jgi:hypothetical protein
MYFERTGVKEPIIVVALDEVIKCGRSRAVEVLRILKVLLSGNTQRFRLLVTTFDDHLLLDGVVASHFGILDQSKIGRRRARGVVLRGWYVVLRGWYCFRWQLTIQSKCSVL